jgi:hypothetical protein
MNNATEQLIRDSLAQFPQPVASATLTDDIVRLAQAHESARHTRPRRLAQILLQTYWLAATTFSVWILLSLPLPIWKLSYLEDASAWVIPLAGVMLLRLANLIDAVIARCTRMLQPFRDLILDDIQRRST